LAKDNDDGADTTSFESRWLARRQHCRSERVMLSAACYVALILIMGAVIFIQLEESAAS